MNRNTSSNTSATSVGGIGNQVAKTTPVPRKIIVPNSNIPLPKFPVGWRACDDGQDKVFIYLVIEIFKTIVYDLTNTLQLGYLFTQGMRNPRQKTDLNSIFTPGNKINSVDLFHYIVANARNSACQRAFNFCPLSRSDSNITLLKTLNLEICSGGLFRIYSEIPFLRPLLVLREARFAYPFGFVSQASDFDGMIRQLREMADSKCSPKSFPIVCPNSLGINASSMGFTTDFLTHTFMLDIKEDIYRYIRENSQKSKHFKQKYRIVLRLGWATTPLIVPKTCTDTRQLMVSENLPRSLIVKVDREPITLSEPNFHGGQAIKLGFRLQYSIDITDKALRALMERKSVEVEICWVHAPLSDSGASLFEAVQSGLISPAVNSLINLPLVQVTLDRLESIEWMINSFASAKPGVSTNEASFRPSSPSLSEAYRLPSFASDTISCLYEFCVSNDRVISRQDTLRMLKSKLENQDGIQCEDSFPASLNCPLTLSRIKIPVKSSMCTHMQCFDLEAFLQSAKLRPRWSCPVCKNPAVFRDLRRDELFQELLQNPSLHNASRIKINASGRVIYVENDDGEERQVPEEEEDQKRESFLKAEPGLPVASQAKKGSSDEVIVIEDSSDEEQEQLTEMRKERSNGTSNNGFARVNSPIPAMGAVGSLPVTSQPSPSSLTFLQNPPPRMVSTTLTRPSSVISVRSATIPHRAPIISGEVVDLTSDNDEDNFEVPQISETPNQVESIRPTTSAVEENSCPSLAPMILPPTESPAPRSPYLVIPSQQQQRIDQVTSSTFSSSATIDMIPNVSSLSPGCTNPIVSTESIQYFLVPVNQPRSGSPIPPCSAQSSSKANSQESSSSVRPSRFKSTAKRRSSNTTPGDTLHSSSTTTRVDSPNLSSGAPVTINVQQSRPLSTASSAVRTRTSSRLASNQSSPLSMPSKNVAKGGGGRVYSGRKRRRVHLEDDDRSASAVSSSTGAPSEDVYFEDSDGQDNENVDSKHDDDDDDSDDEWTPGKLSVSSSSTGRRKALSTSATPLAKRKIVSSGNSSSDGP